MSESSDTPGIHDIPDDRVAAWIGLFQALGFVVVHWGLIERQIDNWVGRLFRDFEGDRLRPRLDLPRSLKQKTAFLSDSFKAVPELAELRPIARDLTSRISIASKRRNDLIHGAISSLEPTGSVFNFEKIDYLPNSTDVTRVHGISC